MLRSLRSFFGRRASKPSLDDTVAYRFSAKDAVHIEQALEALPAIGFHATLPPEKFKEKSEEIARANEGISCGRPPTIGHWVLFALSAEEQAFANAMHFGDHCYDVIGPTDFAEMICDIAGMASRDWRVEDVKIVGKSPAFELGSPARVQIVATPPVTSFELLLEKDFDWSLIYRLNERLPDQITKRFAIFLDGNATIVYLEPDEVEKLNEFCGCHFFYEE